MQRIEKKLPADEYCNDNGYEKKKDFTNVRILSPPPEREDMDAFCKRQHFVKKSQTNALTRKAIQQPIVLKTRVSRTKTNVSPKALSKVPKVLPVIERFLIV
jgi:hypothetical protein